MSLAHDCKKRENLLDRMRREQRTPKIHVDLGTLRPRDPVTGQVVPYTPRRDLKPVPAIGAQDPSPRASSKEPDTHAGTGLVTVLGKSGDLFQRAQPPDEILHLYDIREDAIGKRRWFHRETGKMFRITPPRASITGGVENRARRRSEEETDAADETSPSNSPRTKPSLSTGVGIIFEREIWEVDFEDTPALPKAGICKNPSFSCGAPVISGKPYCPECHAKYTRTVYVSERPAHLHVALNKSNKKPPTS